MLSGAVATSPANQKPRSTRAAASRTEPTASARWDTCATSSHRAERVHSGLPQVLVQAAVELLRQRPGDSSGNPREKLPASTPSGRRCCGVVAR